MSNQPSPITPYPKLSVPTEFGNAYSFWVEYPSGLVDLTRSSHLSPDNTENQNSVKQAKDNIPHILPPPLSPDTQWEVEVEGDRSLRLNRSSSAIVIVDMQNFFLHPDLRNHPTGLACVDPLVHAVNALRSLGVKIIWVNWGLTDHEITTLPPSLLRGFTKGGRGGFGSILPGKFGRLLMRDEYNSALYGPLQPLYEEGKEKGTDVWIHKNRMSGIWGPQTSLDLYLQENGITSLFFAGVNADQCVLGTIVDSYYRGYDCIVVRDIIATTSPEGGLSNVLYNSFRSYGFVTETSKIIAAAGVNK